MEKFSRIHALYMFQAVWHFAGRRRPYVVGTYLAFLTANTFVLWQPWVVGETVNTLQQGGPTMLMDALYWMAIYGLLMMGFWAFHGPARVIENRTAFQIRRRFYDELYAKVTDLPLQWHQDHHSGSIINRINKGARALYDFSSSQFWYLEIGFRFAGAVVAMLLIAPVVGVPVLLSAVVVFSVMALFDRKLVTYYDAENEREHLFSSAFYDYMGNISTVITLRLEQLTHNELVTRLLSLFGPFDKANVLNEIKWFSLWVFITLIEVCALVGYIWYSVDSHGLVMAGTVVALFQYMKQLNYALTSFAMAYMNLMRGHTDLQAVQPILQAWQALDKTRAQDLPTLRDWQQATVSHINFRYADKEQREHQLQDVTMLLQRGRKIALVGHSGAGKSTLMSILRGLYESETAKLTVDGVAFDSALPLMGISTLVPQEPEIFENTIAYNITVGLPHTDTERAEAMRIACFDTVAADLPKGVETDIREKGVNLSGGQKQRLALARGVFAAKDSSLLLLDEPTSSVDALTEAKIYENLFAAFPDMCVVSSIHRLHLLHMFDEIYFMADGKVLEQGSMNDLLAQRGAFYRLWQEYQKHAASA
ncbi:MAG: ATP-binding cassette domain-containing protein [Proteobacteria bacterium]|nr:ATP-binding cassette domain-containing protein [Pseudomonadota bacterium]